MIDDLFHSLEAPGVREKMDAWERQQAHLLHFSVFMYFYVNLMV